MPKQKIAERIQELQEKYGTRRTKQMVTDTRNDYIRKQMELYKEKSRMLQQMMAGQEALTRELQIMEQQIESQRREAEARKQDASGKNIQTRPGPEQPLVDSRQLEEQLNQLTEHVEKEMDHHMQKIQASIEQVPKYIQEPMEQLAQRIQEPIEYLTDEMDKGRSQEEKTWAALEALSGRLDEIREQPSPGAEGIPAELDSRLNEISEDLSSKLDDIKAELSEKVHNESVKCYRNVQSLVEETREELKSAYRSSDSASELQGPVRGAVILGVINLVLILVLGLYELGTFDFLFLK